MDPQTPTQEKIDWKWTGPKEEHMGRRTILWVWNVEEYEYRVLRVHPPNFPVQYGAMGPKSEWSCSYIPDLSAAMFACELEFIRVQRKRGKEVSITSNRYAAFWEERKVLANLSDIGNQAREFRPGQPVPISWIPEGSKFVFIEGKWKNSFGEVLGANSKWTMSVKIPFGLEDSDKQIEELPMDYLVTVPNPTILRRRSKMEVASSDVRKLLSSMGFKAADDERVWPDKRLLGKLNRLPEYTNEMSKLADQHLLNLAVGVCKALEDGVSIVLTGGNAGGGSFTKEEAMTSTAMIEPNENEVQDVNQDQNGQEHPKKTKAPKAPRQKKEKEPKAAKFDLDKYGCRVGSENAKLNEALSSTPKSMGQLVKDAGLKRGLYGHVKLLVKKNLVKETKNGEDRLYSLV